MCLDIREVSVPFFESRSMVSIGLFVIDKYDWSMDGDWCGYDNRADAMVGFGTLAVEAACIWRVVANSYEN